MKRPVRDEEGDPIPMPEKWEICDGCRGDGRRVHEALRVWTESDRHEDPDGFEAMMGGAYDVTCSDCSGSGKVRDYDWDAMTAHQRALVGEHLRELEYDDAVSESERRFGC